jgi:hypothetical protein
MRLIELLDAMPPATRLTNGKRTFTAEQLVMLSLTDSNSWVQTSIQGKIRIYRVRQDGVRRKVYDVIVDAPKPTLQDTLAHGLAPEAA